MAEKNYKLKATPRAGLIAPEGYSIAAVDWSGQEAMIGAYYSQDRRMLEIFRAPLTLPTGEKNPEADLHCYSEDTEILTYQGWKTFDQLTTEDYVAQYDPTNNTISWTIPKDILWEPYKGKMVWFKNKSLDLLVTPNHRMLVKRSKSGLFKTLLAEEVSPTNGDLRIMKSGILASGYPENEDLLKLVVAIQADGSYGRNKKGELNAVVFGLVKSRKIKRLKKILDNLNCRYSSNLFLRNGREETRIRISLSDTLEKSLKYLDLNKNFSNQLLKIDQKGRETVIKEICYWDGHLVKNGDTVLDTTSEETVDILQSLCSISNYRCHRTKYQYTEDLIRYRIYIGNNRAWASLVNSKEEQEYEGYVGCCTVDTGYVLVKRNNVVSISGNSINSMNCTHPHIFRNVPKEKIVKVAKDKSLIPEKGSARDWAKCLQYGIQYLQGANGMASLHNISEKKAQSWIDQHESTFPRYHKWVAEEQHLAEVRGWVQTPQGRTRFVREDNAKAAGASPGRSGVNHLIQGLNKALET